MPAAPHQPQQYDICVANILKVSMMSVIPSPDGPLLLHQWQTPVGPEPLFSCLALCRDLSWSWLLCLQPS